MEPSGTFGEKIETARQLEKDGQLADAADIYQKLFNSDPGAEQVTGRLLVIYRKMKDYRKELSVLNDAIAAHEQRQKVDREKWIQLHPRAANAGKSILRQLEKGSDAVNGLGKDLVVQRWIKRKAFVTGRITGKKAKGASKGKQVPAKEKKAKVLQLSQTEVEKKQRQRQKAVADKKKAAQQRKEALAREKEKERERKAAEKARQKEQQAQKKEDAVRQKTEAERKKAEEQQHPSLFVVLLRYLASIDKIDAMMKQHIAYLSKHYDNGDFLVSGRQAPRAGGVILARGRNKNAVAKMIMQDPFVKHKLASVDIIEFTASQLGKGLEEWLALADPKE